MQYAELLAEVKSRAQISCAEEARTATEAVLRTLVSTMSPDNSHVLYEAIPTGLKPIAGAMPAHPVQRRQRTGPNGGEGNPCPSERARYYVRAVFSTLADHHPTIGHVLARQWPSLGHRRSESHVSFEAQRIGHAGIVFRVSPVSGTVAIRRRRQRTQPEQRQLVQHEPGGSRHRGKRSISAAASAKSSGVTTLGQKLHELPDRHTRGEHARLPRLAGRSLDRLAYGYAAAIRKEMLSNQHREPIGVRTGGRIAFTVPILAPACGTAENENPGNEL